MKHRKPILEVGRKDIQNLLRMFNLHGINFTCHQSCVPDKGVNFSKLLDCECLKVEGVLNR